MRIVHTIAGLRESHGGTSRSVPFLCENLANLGFDVHVITGVQWDKTQRDILPDYPCHVHTAIESKYIRQWGVPRRFKQHLASLTAVPEPTVIHDHGMWLASNHVVANVARRQKLCRVVSIHGMLTSWALQRRGWIKKICWYGYQSRDLKTAHSFISSSEQEMQDLRRIGLTQPIGLIPHAYRQPASLPKRKNTGATKTAVSLTRIHPVKGLIALVEAWKHAGVANDWKLLLAGPDENGHQAEVQLQINRLGLQDRIAFIGPLSDTQKWQFLVDSDLFILSSFSENFGIVVA
ncbi:MAG: glycosyltransferase, partial [Pirellula sp.]